MERSSFIILFNWWLVNFDTLRLDNSSDLHQTLAACPSFNIKFWRNYPLLEGCQVGRGECISLGNDRDQVDTRRQSLHNLDVQGLQSVASRPDEVKASMDTKVNLVSTAGLLLLKHVRFMLVVQELNNWHPRIAVVDVISETRCVDDSKADCGLKN